MDAIRAEGLSKTYRAKVKGEGLGAGFRALFKPEYRSVEAVRDIDITVPQGQILAFIGPNGAGKSTTIKMFCGILQPTSGAISVLGMNPQSQRQKLAGRIGAVFGQKSQLWLHLPALDSFTLLAAIYGVSEADKKARIAELTDIFELGSFLTTPVRKLSLGQRIRCEVAASLLHDPEILFLDEPTIGLDVVVKQAIRGLILKRNREKGTTVFLTSHDPSDIERLCSRVVVIDSGTVVLDSPVERLTSDYLGKKLIKVSFLTPRDLSPMPGVEVLSNENGLRAQISVDTKTADMGGVMEALSRDGGIADVTVSDPPIEEVISAIFRKEAAV